MVSDSKATKTKPTKAKPTKAKPTKAKPIKAKATKTKPTESKATKAAPTRAKASKAKPTKAKPTKAKPPNVKAEKAKPLQTKPPQTKPPQTKPLQTKPLQTKPLQTKPPQTKPPQTKVGKALPEKALPEKVLPPKTKAAKAPPANKVAKARPTKARPTKASGAKTKAAGAARALASKGVRHLPDVHAIAERLRAAIPKPESELAFNTPFGLLTATILAAQSTDKVVNQVMPTLLSRYPTAQALAASEPADVEQLIVPTGFFRNKAKAIRGMAQKLVADHGGEVPRTIEQMVELPGVARKTANVVLGTAFGISSGFIVDTHVARVSQRLGLSEQTDPVRIEQDLCSLFWQTEWIDMAHRLTLHGRYTCLAKAPLCSACPLNELCSSRTRPADQAWPARAAAEDVRASAGLRASRGY